jgi:hypothetical protein
VPSKSVKQLNPPHGSVGMVQTLSTSKLLSQTPRAQRAADEKSFCRSKDLNDPHTAVWGIQGIKLTPLSIYRIAGIHPRACTASDVHQVCVAMLLQETCCCARTVTAGTDDCSICILFKRDVSQVFLQT